jgi:uncharacterized phage-associated protein
VPIGIGKALRDMEEVSKLQAVTVNYHGYFQKRYVPLERAKVNKIKQQERKEIDNVINKLSDMTAKEISEYSHKDIPWMEAKDMEIIDYDWVKKRKPPYKIKMRRRST